MLIAWATPFLHLQKAYWIIISTMAVMLPTVGATLARSKSRAVSTALGVMVGGVISYLFKDNTPAVYFISITLLFFVCYNIQTHYSRAIFSVSILLILIISHFYQTPWEFVFWRFTDTLIGIVIAFIFSILILPCWSKKSIRNTLKSCFTNLNSLTSLVLQHNQDSNTIHLIETTRRDLIATTEKLKNEYLEAQHETGPSNKTLMIIESIIITLTRIRLDLYLLVDMNRKDINNEDIKILRSYSSSILNSLITSLNEDIAPKIIPVPNYHISENVYLKRVIRNYISDLSTLQKNIQYYFC